MLCRCRLFGFACGLTISLSSITLPLHSSGSQTIEATQPDATAVLLQQSRQRYDAGQLNEAKALLSKVQQQSQASGNRLVGAIALSNLALIESDQGNWKTANQAITDSLQSLRSGSDGAKNPLVLAQVLNVQGRLQLTQGNAQSALQTWQQSARLYQKNGNSTGEMQTQLRQAQALQALGLYARAYQEILFPMRDRLQQQPDSDTKVWGLRSVAEAIALIGNRSDAEKVAQSSLTIAKRLKNPAAIAASQLTVANLIVARIREVRSTGTLGEQENAQIQRDTQQAIALYEQIAALASPNQLRAQLNHLALLLESDRLPEASQLASRLQSNLLQLAPDRSSIEAQLNFAGSLLRLQKATQTPNPSIIPLLTTASDRAKDLNDPRLLSNALGHLARSQEQNQQVAAAQTNTEEALLLAKAVNAPELVYRWSAQLGRIQEQRGDRTGAIQSYSQAVDTMRTLRGDLLGLNADAQLVEPETLEPVHRQLVSLLLPKDGSQPSSSTLKNARDIIESLQLEEINNYLRAACLQSKVEIDAVLNSNIISQQTAVVYPIILPDRIAIIVSAAGQETKLYTQPVPQATVEATVKALQSGLRNRISLGFKQPSQQLYTWLIQPIAATLKQQKIETLVFVLDGALRSVPMAALSDGQQFLVEQYSLATTPGLKLTSPQPLQVQALSGIAFGLTEARSINLPNGGSQSFSELPFVKPELEDLQKEIKPSTVELNERFTRAQFQQLLQKSQAPIVHLATHGQFSSSRDQTFLLASDGVIDIDQLATALGARDNARTSAIELLVLSACETAIGDDRAPLGLAGIALKSGARSTVASLWKVNDAATSVLMQRFYQAVATRKVTKAVALQQAQKAILDDPQFRRHPYYWAPFILVGNWL
jgi:CHAT domain-containing protein